MGPELVWLIVIGIVLAIAAAIILAVTDDDHGDW